MIHTRAAVHEQQGISLPDDFHEERYVPNWDCCHEPFSNKQAVSHDFGHMLHCTWTRVQTSLTLRRSV